MQLRDARLCLDCEELHTEESCPLCASEAFAFLTRWIPVNERHRPRRARPATPPAPKRGSRWLTGATTGIALLTAARWLWRALPAPTENRTPPRRDQKPDQHR